MLDRLRKRRLSLVQAPSHAHTQNALESAVRKFCVCLESQLSVHSDNIHAAEPLTPCPLPARAETLVAEAVGGLHRLPHRAAENGAHKRLRARAVLSAVDLLTRSKLKRRKPQPKWSRDILLVRRKFLAFLRALLSCVSGGLFDGAVCQEGGGEVSTVP